MKTTELLNTRRSLATIMILCAAALPVMGEGTEVLGPPIGITVAPGTGIAAGGVGLVTQPAAMTVDVPLGVTVQQVLLYWSGECTGTHGDTINVNGTPILGQMIGGPTLFFSNVYSSTFRADITNEGLVVPGANTLTLQGLTYDTTNAGAGVLVIYDDGGPLSDIMLRDGNDLAFFNFAPPLDTTAMQTFNFPAAATDRPADLAMFFSSVGGTNRPNAIEIGFGGGMTTLVNPLYDCDGACWDTVKVPILVPAGATSVTVQALSRSDGSPNLPASFAWLASTLALQGEPPGMEGCTPGYWKNHLENWMGYAPDDDFDTVFGTNYFDPDITLGQAIRMGGGGVRKLARHGTAALLSAAHAGVAYPISVAEVIAAVQAGSAGMLADYNELGCSP